MFDVLTFKYLLVDLSGQNWNIVNKSLWEPQSKLLLGILNAVRSVNDVATNVNAVGSADASWVGSQWVGGSDDLSCLLNNILSLQSNGNNWTRGDVLDQRWEEWLGGEVRVVVLSQLLWHVHELQSSKNISLGDKTLNDWGNEVALHAIWLDHNIGGLHPI